MVELQQGYSRSTTNFGQLASSAPLPTFSQMVHYKTFKFFRQLPTGATFLKMSVLAALDFINFKM
jgi:hypothetical protein